MTTAAASLAAGLRRWTRTHDLTTRAAVELLITHDVWLHRREFRAACITYSSADCWISWSDARTAFDGGAFVRASSTEIAVLDLAIALGEDRYRFERMGQANTQLIVSAVASALGGAR